MRQTGPDDLAASALLRRHLLQCGAAATVAMLPPAARADDDPARNERPQAGDLLVRSCEGDQPCAVIAPADIKISEPPVLVWAMDPARKLPRDGSRLNLVLLLRFDPATLDPSTMSRAADGVVAYSAICTHAQCPVSGWIADRQVLHCPCHQSEYDPRRNGQVVAGPAPRPLAALPLTIAEGTLQVAGSFIGRVGMDKPSM